MQLKLNTYLYRAPYNESIMIISLIKILKTATPLPFAAIETPWEPVQLIPWTKRLEHGEPIALKPYQVKLN